MDEQRNFITTRDLIPVGIFSAIMIVLKVIVEILGAFGPVVWIFMPMVNAVLLAPVYMLLVSKVPRMGAITVNGILMALFTFIFNGTWIGLSFYLIFSALADISRYVIGCRKKMSAVVSYVLYSLGTIGAFVTFLWLGEPYIKLMLEAGLDQSYIDGLMNLITGWALPAITVGTIITSLVMSFVAMNMVKKNFTKESIV